MATTGPQSTAPKKYPNAVATDLGWAAPVTGEHLVSIKGLAGAISGYIPNSRDSLAAAVTNAAGINVNTVVSPGSARGSDLVFTVTLSAPTVAASNAFTYTLGGTAVQNTEYNPAPTLSNGVTKVGGDLIVPAGVTTFTLTFSTVTKAGKPASTVIVTADGIAGTGTIAAS